MSIDDKDFAYNTEKISLRLHQICLVSPQIRPILLDFNQYYLKKEFFVEKSPEKFWCFGKNPYLCIRFPTKSRIRGFVWGAKQKEFFERIT